MASKSVHTPPTAKASEGNMSVYAVACFLHFRKISHKPLNQASAHPKPGT